MECGNSGAEGIRLLNAVSRKKETVWELGKRYVLPPIYVFTIVYISAQIAECLFYSMVLKFLVVVIFSVEAI